MNINDLEDKYNSCTGCGVCEVICPQNCIIVNKNSNGFFSANVDETLCVNCGLCKSVCYKFYERPKKFNNTFIDKKVYAVWSKNKETQDQCSSGGFATELSLFLFKKCYNICGAKYDYKKNICKHKIARNKNDILSFIGSKYLQSYTVNAFKYLNLDNKNLVFGSPCQIYALRKYIEQKGVEKNFVLVDFFCHGVPSYNLWEKYIDHLSKNGIEQLESLDFVSKHDGWHNRNIFVKGLNKEYRKNYKNDLFGIFFGGQYSHNEPCFNCLFRLDRVYSDIRIGDFWGNRYKNNHDGVNLITINTEQGDNLFKNVRNLMNVEESNFSEFKNSKPWRFYSRPRNYKKISYMLKSSESLEDIYKKNITLLLFFTTWKHRIKRVLKRLI